MRAYVELRSVIRFRDPDVLFLKRLTLQMLIVTTADEL